MQLNEYQKQAVATAIYPHDWEVPYLALAMCGEAGEVADKVKKSLRDKQGNLSRDDRKAIALEIGDVLWYAANLARILGYDLNHIAEMNITKIQSRIDRGTLHGTGDHR